MPFPTRKQPPAMEPPSPARSTGRVQRVPSMNGAHDENGRPIAWGARTGRGYLSPPPTERDHRAMMEEQDIAGLGAGQTGDLTTRNYHLQPQLSNFEAAVAALRATAPTPALSAVSATPSSQIFPSDPNYPSLYQFHPTPAYTLQAIQTSDVNSGHPMEPGPTNLRLNTPVRPGTVPVQAPVPVNASGPSFYERTRSFLSGRVYASSAQQEDGHAHLLRNDQENEQDTHLPSPVTNTKHRQQHPAQKSKLDQGYGYGGIIGRGYPSSRDPETPPSIRRRSQRSRSATPEPNGGDMSMSNTPVPVRVDPFSRVDVTGGRGGTGLGLAAKVTRGLAEKGYGRYDSPDKGSNGNLQTPAQNRGSRGLYAEVGPEDNADDRNGQYEFDITEKLSYDDPSPDMHSPQDTLFETENQYDDEDKDEGGRDLYDMKESATQHFGPAPVGRVVRRHKQLNKKSKRVDLSEGGNLVLDLKIPTRLEGFLPVKGEEEMNHTRYSAVTCDPDEFINQGFELRQNLNGRETEILVVITMFNEDEVLFCSTLYGVMKNIAHLTRRKNSPTWGPEGWKKVVVCIVADGRKHIHPRVLDCLATLGIYQEGAMKSSVEEKAVQAHVFEYTTSFSLTPSMKFKYPEQGNKGIVPVQILFCLKEQNKKKINSHRWFFNAFARSLDPKVCVLLDVGTRPAEKALYHLWKAFDRGSNVGGACGEIATYKGKYWKGLLNPLAASQNFEYKTSNHLDKPTESVFGYLAVLPGAFSAYRWLAIQGQPLKSYFKGEVLTGADADTFTANMYLAEDRILCWEIVAKARSQWVLKFVKAAVAETDCPETVAEFISQRRRWLNGSLFAAVYSLTHLFQVFKTDHSALRKMTFLFQALFNAVNLLFSWFSVANFYIFFVILTSSLEDPSFGIPKIKYLNIIIQYTYVGILIAVFLFSMGNRPKGSPWKYSLAIVLFAILTVYMIICSILCAVKVLQNGANSIVIRMMISLISTYGVFVGAALLSLDCMHIITCFGQYVLLQATYVNILNIYAFSNLHDLSWGTKGSDKVENDLGGVIKVSGNKVEVELLADQLDVDTAYNDALDKLRVRQPAEKTYGMTEDERVQKQKDYYANFRTNVLLFWALTNGLLASAILSGESASTTFTSGSSKTSVYMLATLVFMAGTGMIRLLGALIYALMRPFGG